MFNLPFGAWCVVQTSKSGHQLLLPPADWCPTFASRTTQDGLRPVGRQFHRRPGRDGQDHMHEGLRGQQRCGAPTSRTIDPTRWP